MAEQNVRWPQDATQLTEAEITPNTPLMAANSSDEEKLAYITHSQLADSVGEIIEIKGIEVKPIAGGATSATAVVLPAGPAGENRKMVGVVGWFKNATGSPWEAKKEDYNTNWWDGSVWSLGSNVPLPQAIADGVITSGDTKPVSGDTAFEAINPLDKSVNGEYYKQDIDLSILTNTGGGNATFINLVPITQSGKAARVNYKAPIGSTIKPKIYKVTGPNGSYVYTLLHEYPSIVNTAINGTITVADDGYTIPVGSYLALESSNGIYVGAYTGINAVRTISASHIVNTAYAYDFDILIGSKGALADIETLKSDIKAAPYQTVPSKNLYNRDIRLTNQVVSSSGVIQPNNSYFVAKIPCVTGDKLVLSVPGRNYAFFDNAGNYVAFGGDLASNILSVPANNPNIKFVYVTIQKTSSPTENLMAEKGTVRTSYRPFGDTTPILEKIAYTQFWADKVFTSFGDSNVALETWQYFILNKVPMFHNNRGVGGTMVSVSTGTGISSPDRLAAIPLSDLIVLNGGTNDWRNNVAIGTINDTTGGTFYGGLYLIISYITTNMPKCLLIVNTIPMGQKNPPAMTNNAGVTVDPYNEAIKAICKKYNVPVCDVNQEAGINQFNIDSYIELDPRTAEKIHMVYPEGGKRFAQPILKKMGVSL